MIINSLSKLIEKGLDIDTQKIIAWCKSNIVLVVLIVVSVAAIIGFPQFAATLEDDVQTNLKNRTREFSNLNKHTQTKVSIPGSSETSRVVVNQALIDDYKEVANEILK